MTNSKLSRRELLELIAASTLASALPASAQSAGNALAAPAGDASPNSDCQYTGAGAQHHAAGPAFRRTTLEVSLKPFCKLQKSAIDNVCREIFTSWAPLLRRSDGCAVLLWAADGSEILDYAGRMQDTFDWSRYLGIANPPKTPPRGDPDRLGTHGRNWLYMKNPPQMTYGWLRTIVTSLKRIGQEITSKPVSIGATFDPGPEFAHSDFKYKRHTEITTGNTGGGPNTWINFTAKLNADHRAYAAYPHGIPQGTSFGTFFGQQSQQFLTDLGYDYIWFSNGLGFALSPWGAIGPLFDGKSFQPGPADHVRDRILSFWHDFRSGCPHFPIQTRGSNLTVGAELASNAMPILEIYRGHFGMTAPPNSPWAAIDGDVGLELVGYLSRISELPPGNVYPFRFYTHDPWWMNSPWLDRYGQSPYDIFLPLALARVNGDATITSPAYLEFLTIDDSWGHMPEKVPNEVTPYILSSMDDYSDAPGLVTWIYPFDELNQMTFRPPQRLQEVFFCDWFLRDAVNEGFPLNSVVSTRQFSSSFTRNPAFYQDTVLLAYAPTVNGKLESLLLDGLHRGQNVFLYGPIEGASSHFGKLLNLKQSAPLSGELRLESSLEFDKILHGAMPDRILHTALTSGGPIDMTANGDDGVEVCATVSGADGSRRDVALFRRHALGSSSGALAWVRGSFSSQVVPGKALPQPLNRADYFAAETVMRSMLSRFGYVIRVEKPLPQTRTPLVLIARHKNGFFLSCYSPDETAMVSLRFPLGAPIPVGTETWLKSGFSSYRLPRAWHKEVRCLVDQKQDGPIACERSISENPFIERRVLLKGLQDATVHFFPENQRKVYMAVNDMRTYIHPSHPYTKEEGGKRLTIRHVTGTLLISW